MIKKVKKLTSFIRIILKNPSLINIILNDNVVSKQIFSARYPAILALPQIEIDDLKGNENTHKVESFLLDGSSLITDLQLLQILANRSDVNSYLEIGTWRGESVYNVAKEIDDCTTINLSSEEITSLGLPQEYANLHAILSKKNPKIIHLEANTKYFDFSSLQKKYDLVFIDGDHSYEMVLNDTQKIFKNLLHENSIVVWHDYAYNPQKIRYEVFRAILDGIGKENHSFLYHPKNTMCAVFIKKELPTSTFNELEFPDKIFEIELSTKVFS